SALSREVPVETQRTGAGHKVLAAVVIEISGGGAEGVLLRGQSAGTSLPEPLAHVLEDMVQAWEVDALRVAQEETGPPVAADVQYRHRATSPRGVCGTPCVHLVDEATARSLDQQGVLLVVEGALAGAADAVQVDPPVWPGVVWPTEVGSRAVV